MDSKPLNTPDIEWIMTMLDNDNSWIHFNGFEQMRSTLIRHVQSYYAHDDFKQDDEKQC